MDRITDEDVAAANRRGVEIKAQYPAATSACYDALASHIVIGFENGVQVAIPIRAIPALDGVRPDDLERIEISPSGLGLHIPACDADLSLPELTRALLGPRSQPEATPVAGGQSSGKAGAQAYMERTRGAFAKTLDIDGPRGVIAGPAKRSDEAMPALLRDGDAGSGRPTS